MIVESSPRFETDWRAAAPASSRKAQKTAPATPRSNARRERKSHQGNRGRRAELNRLACHCRIIPTPINRLDPKDIPPRPPVGKTEQESFALAIGAILDVIEKIPLSSPERKRLKYALRVLGHIIGGRFTFDDMGRIADTAANLTGSSGKRISPLNSAWDNIRTKDGGWWMA